MPKVTINGSDIAKALVDAGVLPPNCKRVIIDIRVQDVVVAYFETFAEPDLVDAVSGQIILNKEKCFYE